MSVEKYERQLVKGYLNMLLAKGYSFCDIKNDVSNIECQLMHITGNNEYSHRLNMEEYISKQIARLG